MNRKLKTRQGMYTRSNFSHTANRQRICTAYTWSSCAQGHLQSKSVLPTLFCLSVDVKEVRMKLTAYPHDFVGVFYKRRSYNTSGCCWNGAHRLCNSQNNNIALWTLGKSLGGLCAVSEVIDEEVVVSRVLCFGTVLYGIQWCIEMAVGLIDRNKPQ